MSRKILVMLAITTSLNALCSSGLLRITHLIAPRSSTFGQVRGGNKYTRTFTNSSSDFSVVEYVRSCRDEYEG